MKECNFKTNQDLVFVLDGHILEFKSENEFKPDGDIYLTYFEAKRFIKPDKDGWRLPTRDEIEALIKNYPHKFEKKKGCIFDNRLVLDPMSCRNLNGLVRSVGYESVYWTSTPDDTEHAWFFYASQDEIVTLSNDKYFGFSVRLVRDVV